MDTHAFWLQAQALWATLEHQPLLRTGLALAVLLGIALGLGRLARQVLLYGMRLLGRQPALHWLDDLHRNKVFHRLAQTVPSLVIQFGLALVPGLSDKTALFIGNLALAVTFLCLTLALAAGWAAFHLVEQPARLYLNKHWGAEPSLVIDPEPGIAKTEI